MGISLGRARRAKSELYDIASDLRDFKSQIDNVKRELRGQWKADEMHIIEDKFEGLSRYISHVEDDLCDIGRDIYKVAKEIKKEEEERERRRRARAAAK